MRLHDCIAVLEAPGDNPGVSRVHAMQVLIDHGVVWTLRPEFGMLAEWLIDEGLCTPRVGCGRVARCGRKKVETGGLTLLPRGVTLRSTPTDLSAMIDSPVTDRPQFCCTAQSNVICLGCAEKKQLLAPAADRDAVVDHGTNWEDAALYCDYCDIRIPSKTEAR